MNGVQLNVERSGVGPPVLCLHGFTGSLRTWDALAEALSDRFTVLTVDLLGHGRSDAPPDAQRYSAEQTAADLVALLHQLGYERASFVGYSMGGRVALQAAVAYPHAVSALVLESASPGIAADADRYERRRSDGALAEIIEREGVEAFVGLWERVPLFASQASLPPDVLDAQRRERLQQSAVGLAGSLRGLGAGTQQPLFNRLEGLAMPVLLIAGELDAKYSRLATEMARAVPSARSAIVPGAGHNVHLEKPEEFERLVVDFLSEQEV